MSETWKKVVMDILKYSVGAVLGALGLAASGCALVPVFDF